MPACSAFAGGFPRGTEFFKGILKADKSLLFRGGRNTIVMLSSSHTPSFSRSSALRWKACSVSRRLKNGCDRFSLLELSGARCPPRSLLALQFLPGSPSDCTFLWDLAPSDHKNVA